MAQGQGRTGRREPSFGGAPEVRASAPERAGSAPPKPRRKRKRRKKRARRSLRARLGRVAYWALVACLWLGLAGIGTVVWVGAHLPPIQSLAIPKQPPSIRIVDDQGHLLARRGNLAGTPVALKELPRYVPRAFVAVEDRRFYEHFGIDPYGIARALVADVLHGGVREGASTITQQLAKNLFLTQRRTITRKLQEMLLALWLEHKFSKAQILQMYLNRVYFGAGAYGIEAAAERYFGKSARSLTLAEAAMLAGLVQSPSRLAPTRDYKAAERRARLVLADMREQKYISKHRELAALAHPPHIAAQTVDGSVNYVADWVMDVVNDVIGHVDHDIVVHTTIDSRLQAAAERAVGHELDKYGNKYKVSQGALVAMTPRGAVRALIGGRDYAQSQYNRAVTARRQPGSAFKPFVYLTALEHGLTPDTIRDDRPIDVNGWKPENYGHEYFGPVTLTRALALSLNSVSVRLTLEFGPAAVVRTAHALGITSHLQPDASIALGTSEVSVLELTGAYASFANGGLAVVPHVIMSITTAKGKLLYAHPTPAVGRIIDARYVGMMNAMMQQTLLIGTAKHASFHGWPAAGKTGTSQDFRDAWFVGYTAHMVTGVWLGNDDGTPTRHVTGGSLPVQIWSRFMRAAHQGLPVADLPGTPSNGGGFLSRLFGSSRAPAPRPPVSIESTASAAPTTTGSGGLDGWLINNLLGRRR